MDGNRSVVLGEAIANSSSGGGVGGHESGSQENGMSFGLGVGFALSPELAQKVLRIAFLFTCCSYCFPLIVHV